MLPCVAGPDMGFQPPPPFPLASRGRLRAMLPVHQLSSVSAATSRAMHLLVGAATVRTTRTRTDRLVVI